MKRTIYFILPACLALAWVLPTTAQTTPSVPAVEAAHLDRLMTQLGSPRFAERQAASAALEALGDKGLAVLHAAARDSDLEVRRRALELVARIERRLETTRLLTPQPVQLSYQDTPFSDACRDFEKRTGFTLKIANLPQPDSRTVTLRAADVTRWQALEQFCGAAGLVELRVARVLDGSSVLLRVDEGKGPAPVPTCDLGRVQLRALPHGSPGWGQTPGVTEVRLLLEVAPEPGLTWRGGTDIRIDRAVDDQGQRLGQLLQRDETDDFAKFWGHSKQMKESADDADGLFRVPVTLRLAGKPSRCVKEMQGVLFGQVETPPEQLVTVAAILKSAGQTFRGKDGCTLRIVEVNRERDVVKVTVEYRALAADDPADPANLTTRGKMAWALKRAQEMHSEPRNAPSIELRDNAGRSFECARDNEAKHLDGRQTSYSATLHFSPRGGVGEPDRLILSGRRIVTVEVPFTLKDVPLP